MLLRVVRAELAVVGFARVGRTMRIRLFTRLTQLPRRRVTIENRRRPRFVFKTKSCIIIIRNKRTAQRARDVQSIKKKYE